MNPEKKVDQLTSFATIAKINEAIQNLERRLTLNAQSIIPTLPGTPIHPSVLAHNQRAYEAINECQLAIDKLNFLLTQADYLSEFELTALFEGYSDLSMTDLEKTMEQYGGKTS